MAMHVASKRLLVLLALMGLITGTSCNKEQKPAQAQASPVPHKEVPRQFRGDFTWTKVSDNGYTGQNGSAYPASSAGTIAHLNKDGTGTWVFRYDITYANGGHKSVHIDSDVAYEVTRLSDTRVTIVVHFIRGKNYEDDQFLHDLDASRLYPNGDVVYENVEYGTDGNGKLYVKAGPEVTFTKK